MMSMHELLSFLDREGVEWPANFDREVTIQQVLAIQEFLESALGVQLELDSNAQDATFACNLGCLQNDDGIRREDYSVCLTFSNFGNLCLLWGDQDWLNQHGDKIRACETALSECGYVPMRPWDVEEAYDGHHIEWSGKTWLDRFFGHY